MAEQIQTLFSFLFYAQSLDVASSPCSAPFIELEVQRSFKIKAAVISILPAYLHSYSCCVIPSSSSSCLIFAPTRMSDRPSRHQRRASQTVFAMPDNLSISETAPLMVEGGEKKTAATQGQPSSGAADPPPPSSVSATRELEQGVSKK